MKIVLFAIIYLLATAAMAFSENITENKPTENPEQDMETRLITKIARIEVGVETKEVRIFQENEGSLVEQVYPAATASPGKNSRGIPYGKVGVATKIVFNPGWTPTKDIWKEYFKKRKKPMKKYFHPGASDNPLGLAKIFISYNGYNSTLGIHTTNEPRSIGRRVSHGCTRISDESMLEIASIILKQNGHDAEKIIGQALENPTKPITILLEDGPEVIYMKK
ncbi:MAG TPA: L,D-transpeptidase family protein [Patescibacteria group bacterium]